MRPGGWGWAGARRHTGQWVHLCTGPYSSIPALVHLGLQCTIENWSRFFSRVFPSRLGCCGPIAPPIAIWVCQYRLAIRGCLDVPVMEKACGMALEASYATTTSYATMAPLHHRLCSRSFDHGAPSVTGDLATTRTTPRDYGNSCRSTKKQRIRFSSRNTAHVQPISPVTCLDTQSRRS